MSAETGFEGDATQAPIRVSGFLASLFGLGSALSFMSIPMLLVPFAAICFGLFALRRHDGLKPIGTSAAYFGILMAAGFGAIGLGIPLFKTQTLGSQSEYFAREYLEVVANGELEYAWELHKAINNRFLASMPLEEHYRSNDEARKTLEEFRQESINSIIAKIGPGAKWELDRATRVYHQYGKDNSEVVLAHYGDDGKPVLIQFYLECWPHSKTGVNEWHVKVCQVYRERIVAESVL